MPTDKLNLKAFLETKIKLLDEQLTQLSYKPWHTEDRMIVQGKLDILEEVLEELEKDSEHG